MLQRLTRPGPAPGAGMGAKPALPADRHVVVIFVVAAEHLFRQFLVLFDSGEEKATRVPARSRPGGPVEELHHPCPEVVLLPGKLNRKIGYFLGSGTATSRALPNLGGGENGAAPFDD